MNVQHALVILCKVLLKKDLSYSFSSHHNYNTAMIIEASLVLANNALPIKSFILKKFILNGIFLLSQCRKDCGKLFNRLDDLVFVY